MSRMEDMSMAGSLILEQAAHNHPNFVSRELVEKMKKDLAKIK